MTFYELIGAAAIPVEVAQLVMAERRIGVKVLRAGLDPRHETAVADGYARAWLGLIAFILIYPVVLLCFPESRFFAYVLMLFTALGYILRKSTGLRWALVVLTLEGALRIGTVANLLIYYRFVRH